MTKDYRDVVMIADSCSSRPSKRNDAAHHYEMMPPTGTG
jgi:hypothetical protein